MRKKKKQLGLALVLILSLCISTSYAQEQSVVETTSMESTEFYSSLNVSGLELTRSYYDDCQEEIKHSQKTLTWANGYGGTDSAQYYSLTLSRFKCEDKELSRFILHYEDPTNYSNSSGDYLYNDWSPMNIFVFPDTMTIYDVKVFDDIVYFCGRIISKNYYRINQITPNILEYEQYDTSGVVGWIPVSTLFNSTTIPISYVTSGYTFTKLRTFKDINDNLTTKIAAMGTFRNASYTMAMPISTSNPNTVWITMPPTYNDMVFIYNISGPSSYVKSPNRTNVEKFQDIKLIGGDIAILSLIYDGNPSNNVYTPTGELTSDLVRYRTIKASDLTQTNTFFEIKWIDIDSNQYYDIATPKGIYNARLDYAGEFDGFYTNLNTGNNTGNLVGFGIDDDLPAYGYDNYRTCKLPYQYNLVMSFNHYEARQEGPYYAVVMNWLSHRELIHAHNPNYMGAKCSARIYEGVREMKLIDANRMIGNIYPRLTATDVSNHVNPTAFSDFNVILENENEYDYIYVVHLDDHNGDAEYFWTNTLNASNRNENSYIHGNPRLGYEIIPAGIFDPTLKNKFNDINTIVGERKYFFRAVGNLEDVMPFRPLSFFQYTNNLNEDETCYYIDGIKYDDRAYPVTINYQDTPDLITYTYSNGLTIKRCSFEYKTAQGLEGSCSPDFLQTK